MALGASAGSLIGIRKKLLAAVVPLLEYSSTQPGRGDSDQQGAQQRSSAPGPMESDIQAFPGESGLTPEDMR